ncbi:nitrate reductase molybdenum cofactor assembly chaperone [Saccharothrix australiensis]|uniref:Respiratory nitrate reductase chaperone NarJ n=1 Tax=Saccharothrix australiensis TaxID=2072 RepID=A0A495VYI9_9PSEU|nr:nitrate reductase molybdenum cofactor assembly chaperone [Saccharothrix australiensis]RKT53807.1 respiratory nitrate reductase chaperone NarJ [Saccharothrix australiensis]
MTTRRSRAVGVLQHVAAHCLHYPDDGLLARLPLLRRCLAEVPRRQAPGVAALLDHLGSTSPVAAGRHYVEVFDTEADRCLHLTWFTDGETRRRGGSLATLQGVYRRHGFRPAGGELPDYLPVLLEFAAVAGAPGQALLAEFQPALDLLHRNLAAIGTPYAPVVAAVVATLPQRSDHRRPDHRRPVAVGGRPPTERVGVEPVLLGYPTPRPT